MIRIVLVLLISLFSFIEVYNTHIGFEGNSKECVLNSTTPNLNVESEALDPLQSLKVARDQIIFSEFEWKLKEFAFQQNKPFSKSRIVLTIPLLTVSFLI